MKIAVPNKQGFISPQLNQFTKYSIFTINGNNYNLIDVLDVSHEKNYHDIAIVLRNEGVEITLVNRIGRRAYESFIKQQLKVIDGYKGAVSNAVEEYIGNSKKQ
ncbi:MAG: hypothetical protein K9L17_03975 [Clostridiales bacterium]|nr:hypothetical protein [Clostridiales bacterium]MCF8021837.1 hypothetical protein [Clostridiales bacterium]